MDKKKWGYWILTGVLTAGIIGTGYWGYGEYLVRQKLQNRAEGQYQRAFHEMSWHIDTISGQLAQILVSKSKEQGVISLATLWRQVFAAQANLGELPLAFMPLSKTEKFLADTGDVSFALLSRTAQDVQGLNEKEQNIIEQLYERSKGLREDMTKLSSEILDRQLSWTQVEVAALQSNKQLEDNTILDGFDLMERRMEEYPEIDLGQDFSQVRPDIREVRSDQKITLENAQRIAHDWWYSKEDAHQAKLAYEGVGDIPTYGLEFNPLEGEDNPLYLDISKLDGTVIWAMQPKTISEASLNTSDGEIKAQEFLSAHGFQSMALVKAEQDDNAGIYTLVPRQGDVLLYPDQVKVQVALDNGEVIGYEGTPYYMYHKERDLPQPKINEEQLRKQVSPYIKIELIRPALIANTWGKEILSWEVRGSFEEEKFVIFYNADSGSEEQITRLTPPPKFEFALKG